MKMRKVVSGFAAFSMAVSLMTGFGFNLEIKAEGKSLADEISELDIKPEKDIELIAEHYDDVVGEWIPASLLLHGNAVIFTTLRASNGWTKVYLDVNKNGKVDTSIDKELNLGSYADTNISGTASMGYDLSEVTVYAIGDFEGNYTEHEGDLLVTISHGATLAGIVGSTASCSQTGDFLLNTLADDGEIGYIEGAGAGTWNGSITMNLAGEMILNEVYGGSKEADTTITGNVVITSNNENTTIGVFGDSAYFPESGGAYAGGSGTIINGDFEILIQNSGVGYIFYNIDASEATIDGNVNYKLASSDLYGTLKTNEAAAEDSRTTIEIAGFNTKDNGKVTLYEGETVKYIDKMYAYTSFTMEPEINVIGTVVAEAADGVTITAEGDEFKGIGLLRNTKLIKEDNTIKIGREINAKELTFVTGTDKTLEPQLEIKGDAIKLPVIKRDGYEFLGWSDGVNTYAPGSDYTIPEGDVTLTAVWKSTSSSSSSAPSTGFVKKKGETYFYNKGKPVENGFVIVNEKEKLVDTVAPGKLTELEDSEYKAYYAKPDGSVAKAEWIVIDSKGKLVETLPIGEFKKQYGNDYKVYLADANGKLIRSWKDTENNWYYFNADFSAKYEYWQAHYEDWYYFDNYSYLKNTWHATDNGRWYYFNAEGKMVRNQWVDGCWINELGIYWSPIYSDPEFIANYKQ